MDSGHSLVTRRTSYCMLYEACRNTCQPMSMIPEHNCQEVESADIMSLSCFGAATMECVCIRKRTTGSRNGGLGFLGSHLPIPIFLPSYPPPTHSFPSFVYSRSEEAVTLSDGVPFIVHAISDSRASRSNNVSKLFRTPRERKRRIQDHLWPAPRVFNTLTFRRICTH